MYVCAGLWPSDVSDERVWETTLIYLVRVVCNWCIAIVFVSVCVFIMVRLFLVVGQKTSLELGWGSSVVLGEN